MIFKKIFYFPCKIICLISMGIQQVFFGLNVSLSKEKRYIWIIFTIAWWNYNISDILIKLKHQQIYFLIKTSAKKAIKSNAEIYITSWLFSKNVDKVAPALCVFETVLLNALYGKVFPKSTKTFEKNLKKSLDIKITKPPYEFLRVQQV